MDKRSIDIAQILMEARLERRQGELDGMLMAAEVLESLGRDDAAVVVRKLRDDRALEPVEDPDP